MKTLLYIYNPVSGKGQAASKITSVLEYYTKKGYLVTVYPMYQPGDAATMIENYLDMYDLVVCVGGDGTLHQAVEGYGKTEKKKGFGYIPTGSTNDFAKNLNIPQNFNQAMQMTLEGKEYQIDIGDFSGEKFIYVAAFGLFTDVSYKTPQKQKNMLGHVAYVLEGMKRLPEIKAVKARFEYNGSVTEGEFIVGLITNSSSVAGFKSPVCTDVDLNDGVFELLLVKKPASLIELGNIASELMSGDFKSDAICYAQVSAVHVESEPIEWSLDGEYGGIHENLDIRVIPDGVRIIGK